LDGLTSGFSGRTSSETPFQNLTSFPNLFEPLPRIGAVDRLAYPVENLTGFDGLTSGVSVFFGFRFSDRFSCFFVSIFCSGSGFGRKPQRALVLRTSGTIYRFPVRNLTSQTGSGKRSGMLTYFLGLPTLCRASL